MSKRRPRLKRIAKCLHACAEWLYPEERITIEFATLQGTETFMDCVRVERPRA